MQPQRSVHHIALLAIAFILLPILSCEWFASKGPTITSAVLARDVKSDTLDPLEITDVFTEDQPQFHAVIGIADAPAGTIVKAVWTALDVGNAAPPETVIHQSEQKAQGTQNIHFDISPDLPLWPAGTYKMDLYVNGGLVQTLNFQVVASATRTKSLTLVCPPLPPPSLEPSDIIVSVTMAVDVQGQNREPVGETNVFPPSATFHAVVLVVDAPNDTSISAAWFATDLGELSSCNTGLLKTDIVVDDTRNVDFSMQSRIPWPEGLYRVEISEDGKLVQVVPFEVSGAAPSLPTPAGQH